MHGPKPTDVLLITDNSVVTDPKLTKSRFRGSFDVKTRVFTPAKEGAVEISEQAYNAVFIQKEDIEKAHNQNN